MQPITIYYEHPEWFTGLFARLDERRVPYQAAKPENGSFDAGNVRAEPTSLFVNRMSSSAADRGLAHAIPYTQKLLAYLERRGVPVFNGSRAFGYEISKARQHDLLQSLGIATPRTLVTRCDSQLLTAAKHLEFPVLVKPNAGGTGAGITRFDTEEELRAAVQGERCLPAPTESPCYRSITAPRMGGSHAWKLWVANSCTLSGSRSLPSGVSISVPPTRAESSMVPN